MSYGWMHMMQLTLTLIHFTVHAKLTQWRLTAAASSHSARLYSTLLHRSLCPSVRTSVGLSVSVAKNLSHSVCRSRRVQAVSLSVTYIVSRIVSQSVSLAGGQSVSWSETLRVMSVRQSVNRSVSPVSQAEWCLSDCLSSITTTKCTQRTQSLRLLSVGRERRANCDKARFSRFRKVELNHYNSIKMYMCKCITLIQVRKWTDHIPFYAKLMTVWHWILTFEAKQVLKYLLSETHSYGFNYGILPLTWHELTCITSWGWNSQYIGIKMFLLVHFLRRTTFYRKCSSIVPKEGRETNKKEEKANKHNYILCYNQ